MQRQLEKIERLALTLRQGPNQRHDNGGLKKPGDDRSIAVDAVEGRRATHP